MDWRDELAATPWYQKKFALLPVKTKDGEIIWLSSYYKKFVTYRYQSGALNKTWDDGHEHTDFVENITEETFVVRKLSENL